MISIFFALSFLPFLCFATSPIPLLAWSNQRVDVPQASSLDTISAFVTQNPEIVFGFVTSRLGTSDFARAIGAYSNASGSNFQNLIETSPSSQFVPYTYLRPSEKFSDILVDAVTKVSPKARILVSQLSGQTDEEHVAGCDALLSSLNEETALLNNGVSDLVLVESDAFDANMEACIGRLISHVTNKNKQYSAVVTGDTPAVDVLLDFPLATQPMYAYHSRRLLQSSGSTTNYTGPQYITPTILWAILLTFFLIFLLWTGLSCLLEIEAPVRYAIAPPIHSLSKEY